MLKQVLVPLDGSQLAEEALAYAQQIVDPNGRIVLVTAVTMNEIGWYYPGVTLPMYETVNQDMVIAAREYLQYVATYLSDGKVTIEIEVEVGNPANVICEAAETYNVDAIVMSTHGRSGLSRWLLGSITSKVLSAKPCPLFIVPSAKRQTDEAPKSEAVVQ